MSAEDDTKKVLNQTASATDKAVAALSAFGSVIDDLADAVNSLDPREARAKALRAEIAKGEQQVIELTAKLKGMWDEFNKLQTQYDKATAITESTILDLRRKLGLEKDAA